MDPEELKRLNAFVRQKTKPELTKLCQEKNLSVKGTKHDLAVRLLGIELRPKVAVQRCEEDKVSPIVIRKSPHGHYVHCRTKLVFDKDSKKVIGKEEENGHVKQLCRNDIQICRQFKFQYCMPEMIDLPDVPIHRHEDDAKENTDVSDIDDDLDDDDEEIMDTELCV